jgi:oxygen-independent coproporphyrinogen-3 oxidase
VPATLVSRPSARTPASVEPAPPRFVAPAPVGAEIGIYLHVPFCAHVCPYCDFNTYAGQGALIPRYVAALEREIAAQGEALGDRRAATIFFGGGTPSLLPPGDIALLVRACRAAFAVDADAEISVEANPNGVDEAYFAVLLEAGVNRISLGAQTLNRRGLRVLGRLHEATETAAAVAAARRAGFANLSLDLIFGWPGQTLDAWRADLDAVLSGEVGGVPEHLSLYSLIVEPGTPMADAVARGILAVPDDDDAADLYETAIEQLDRAGWTHYEVANWSRRPELASRHNAIYWRNGDYAGLGAGAHGHAAGRRVMNHPLPATYCAAVERGEPSVSNSEEIPPRVAEGETMMLGLRLLRDGVSAAAFHERHGRSLEEAFGPTIAELLDLGLLRRAGDRLLLSQRGLMLANDVCARFV